MNTVSRVRYPVSLIVVLVSVTAGYFVQPLFADTFECCNNLTHADECNGCIDGEEDNEGRYYWVGVNPVYRCAEYTNPVSCYENNFICVEGEFERHTNAGCISTWISWAWPGGDPPEPPSDYIVVTTVGCPQDSCD